MQPSDIFSSKDIKVGLESDDKDEVLEELLEILIANYPEIDRVQVLEGLKVREAKMSTGIFPGVAIPHVSDESVPKVLCAIGVSKKGIDFDSFDKKPTYVFFLVLSNTDDHAAQLRVLQSLSFILNEKTFVTTIMGKKTSQEVFETLRYFENFDGM
jgi:PTS system fructose-specific IIC component/PTS system nitrogen regulatory IIA component